LNEERENASFPISVFVIGKKKKVFSPGTEVDLMDYHIEVLRNAVDETEIEIPQESGIYEAANPTRVAENNFPGFRASVSEVDGTITMRRSIPKYSVEIIKPLEEYIHPFHVPVRWVEVRRVKWPNYLHLSTPHVSERGHPLFGLI
jgi:hypothetical protein